MTLNIFIQTMTTIISIFSLYFLVKYRKEQQQLKEKMQQNEFDFSKRKVWFEKQNEVIDKSIEKMVSLHQLTGEIITYSDLKGTVLSNQTNIVSHSIQERVEKIIINTNYLNSHKHYFNEIMEKKVNIVLKSSNKISAQLNQKIREDEKISASQIKKFRTDLEKIAICIRNITNETRKEYLNL